MSDPISTFRGMAGDDPFPMTFKLEADGKGFKVVPTDAQGEEGPPLRGKTPSEALWVLARAMRRAENLADLLLDILEEEVAKEASKN